jgi:hypothetical protein
MVYELGTLPIGLIAWVPIKERDAGAGIEKQEHVAFFSQDVVHLAIRVKLTT